MNDRVSPRFSLRVVALAVYWLALLVLPHIVQTRVASVQYSDKIAHFVAFAGLGLLMAWGVSAAGRITFARYVIVLAVIAIYAAADETIQAFVPHRFGDILDWLADVSGAVAGLTAHYLTMLALSTLAKGSSPDVPPLGAQEAD